MPLTLAGIDEAGYGPLLGPLTVGLTVFRIHDWNDGDPPPDLWQRLAKAVCRSGSDKLRRIPVDDSKKLKLSNDGKKHPLTHLEMGVLSFLACEQRASERPPTDSALFDHLAINVDDKPWYTDPTDLPLAAQDAQIGIAANELRRALASAGIEILDMRCACTFERQFNDVVRQTGTKASVTGRLIADHLRHVAHEWGGEAPRLVCDRQSGRVMYRNLLEGAIPDAEIETINETPKRSRYRMTDGDRSMTVLFEPEADATYLPVALASMIAKFVRELLMGRFNRYWCAQMPELKPTAGYRTDAHRWLHDADPILTAEHRAAMIRNA